MNSTTHPESPTSTEAGVDGQFDASPRSNIGLGPDSQTAASNRRIFKFPLPFDPFRLLSGIVSRWPFILLCVIATAFAGSYVGRLLSRPSYSLSVSMLKRKVPQSMQTGEVGQAYRPADLNDPTLLATLLALEPLEKAALRVNNGLDASTARRCVDAAQQKGTDIYFITYHSPVSSEDAVAFLQVWAEEINNYTRRLQQSDAIGVRDILKTEVTDLDKQLDGINKQILDFSRDKQFLGTQSQVLAALNQLGQVTLELENAKSALAAKEAQIKSITQEIQRQSPIESQIKIAREEVSNLRSTYTDENPLVKAKLQAIEYLEENLKNTKSTGPIEIESYTGTPIGNQLYLDILSCRNERNEFAGKVETYTRLKETVQKRVDEFPAIVSRYEELQKVREGLLSSRSLLNNRLKETEIFASGSPGYWQIFQGPNLRDVTADSMMKKPVLLGAVGGLGGLFSSVVLILVVTSRSKSRSVLECCTACQAPFLVRFSPNRLTAQPFDELWIQCLADAFAQRNGRLLFWCGHAAVSDERMFWAQLAEAAKRDGGSLPTVMDLTPDGLWNGHEPSPVAWTSAEGSTVPHVYRATKLPPASGRNLLKDTTEWFCLASGNSDSLKRAGSPRELLSLGLPPCTGVIAAVDSPKSLIRRAADSLSILVARQFSRSPLPVSTHD
jgi:uncharacterized protein involved in exopolysaccharide biosynthesis